VGDYELRTNLWIQQSRTSTEIYNTKEFVKLLKITEILKKNSDFVQNESS
jgi:hypothetical protein